MTFWQIPKDCQTSQKVAQMLQPVTKIDFLVTKINKNADQKNRSKKDLFPTIMGLWDCL